MTAIVNGHPVEPGCYIDGHWGQYSPDRLAEIAEGFGWSPDKPTDDPRVIRAFADQLDEYRDLPLWEWHSESADDIETWLNDHTVSGWLPGADGGTRDRTNFVWHWHDGEFFLSPLCDDPDDCTDVWVCTDCLFAHWE